jgi:hypothetical protein
MPRGWTYRRTKSVGIGTPFWRKDHDVCDGHTRYLGFGGEDGIQGGVALILVDRSGVDELLGRVLVWNIAVDTNPSAEGSYSISPIKRRTCAW